MITTIIIGMIRCMGDESEELLGNDKSMSDYDELI
jgi:hypothetical protein